MALTLLSKAACLSRVQAAPKASRPAVLRAAVVVKAQASQDVVSEVCEERARPNPFSLRHSPE